MAVNVLGLIGCIVGATAKSIDQLIGANACNGLAAAGQLSFGIILGELVPNKQRGPIVTLTFFSSMPFAVFGPVIARSFILKTSSGWRWSYYLGIIMEVVALVLYQFLYHPPRFDQLHEGKTKWQAFRELDFGGIVLFVSGFVIFIIGLSWGGTTYPWKSSQVISTLVVGGVLIIGFGVYGEQFSIRFGSVRFTDKLCRDIHLQGRTSYAAPSLQEARLRCSRYLRYDRSYGLLLNDHCLAIRHRNAVHD
jgi:MFS family permease